MHSICLSSVVVLLLLACCGAPTPSLPQSNCAGEQQSSPKPLEKCVAPGNLENLRESRCVVGLGLDRGRCKTSCSGLSPSIRQDFSVYSTGMAMDQPNPDGDSQTPSVLTMVSVSHDNRLHDGAAMESRKYSDNVVPQLSNPLRRRSHRHRRRVTPATGQQQQQQQQHMNDMSTMRKVLGGIAVAVLVMVV